MEPYFRWTYKPPAYFEEPFEIEVQGYRLKLVDGIATASPLSPDHLLDDDARRLLTAVVENALCSDQLRSQASFELSGPSLHHEGGITAFARGVAIGVSVCSADIRALDADGNVGFDSRRARIEEKAELAELAARHAWRDPTADRLLQSSKAARGDPDNELVHLYEIVEALERKLGGRKKGARKIGMAISEWRRLAELSNDPSLMEGRHRGKDCASLRPASEDELREARRIARRMILLYLRGLEEQAGTLDE